MKHEKQKKAIENLLTTALVNANEIVEEGLGFQEEPSFTLCASHVLNIACRLGRLFMQRGPVEDAVNKLREKEDEGVDVRFDAFLLQSFTEIDEAIEVGRNVARDFLAECQEFEDGYVPEEKAKIQTRSKDLN